MKQGGAPLRFIAVVLALWGGGRALWLVSPSGSPAIASNPSPSRYFEAKPEAMPALLSWLAQLPAESPSPAQLSLTLPMPAFTPATVDPDPIEPMFISAALGAPQQEEMLTPIGAAPPRPRLDLDLAVKTASRWSGSAWTFVRQGSGGRSLAALGQLGGSQAGAVVRWRINPGDQLRTALYGRVSSPLENGRGAETAIGAEWHPLPGQPIWIAAERRIAIGKEGRDAWSAYVAGGVWKPGLPLGLTLDAYAQAGVVGAKQRDLFADGAARLSRPVAGESSPRIGAGVWAAAQPGVARVDIGPHARIPLKLSKQPLSLSADYRVRVAGDARPGSGVAVTLASDF
jgi:hypothetical protein